MKALLKLLKFALRLLKFAAKPKLPARVERLILRRIIASPQLAAKFYPYEGARRAYILPKVSHEHTKNESSLPIPPQDLWLGYGETPEQYLAWGRHHTCKMKDILEASGFSLGDGPERPPLARSLHQRCFDQLIRKFAHVRAKHD